MRLLECLVNASAYDHDAAIHFARMSDTSDVTLLRDINQLIVNLKADGVWDVLDDFCVIHSNLADSLLGLKGTQDSAELSAGSESISYSSTGGIKVYDVDGSNYAFIDTQINNTTGNYGDADGSLFAFMTSETGGHAGNSIMGHSDASNNGIYLISDDGAPLSAFGGESSIPANYEVSVAAGNIGFIGGSRTSTTSVEVRFNGSNATDTDVSVGGSIAGFDILVGCYNLNGAPFAFYPGELEFSAWGVGGGLTTTQLSDLRDHIQTYMTARGV